MFNVAIRVYGMLLNIRRKKCLWPSLELVVTVGENVYDDIYLVMEWSKPEILTQFK